MHLNNLIRKTAKEKGIRLWELADQVGISESTMTRWMRMPLTFEQTNMLTAALRALAKEKAEANRGKE